MLQKIKRFVSDCVLCLRWYRVPEEQKQTRLDSIKNYLRQMPETKRLLDEAEQNGTIIEWKMPKPGGWTAAETSIDRNDKVRVSINPFADFGNLVQTLIHELRHTEQYRRLGFDTAAKKQEFHGRSPMFAHMLSTVMEADAYAYTALMKLRANAVVEEQAAVSQSLKKQIQDGTLPPELQNNEALNALVQAPLAKVTSPEAGELKEQFMKEIRHLSGHRGYNSHIAAGFYKLHIKDWFPVKVTPQAMPPDMAEIKKVAAYLADIPDSTLKEKATAGMAEDVKKTFSLMEHFNDITRRGVAATVEEKERLKQDIRQSVRSIMVWGY